MALAIRQLQKHFVGEVSGLDLRVPLTKEQAAEVEAAMDKYAVLVFHGQDLTDEQQLAFALNFGEREKARGGTVVKKEDYRLTSGLNRLKEKHNVIGDVRGKGLMLGIELVKDRATKEPAKAECAQVLETCRDLGLLLGKGGLHGQTIRFSPPMCIHQQDTDFVLEVLDQALRSL